MKIICRSLLCMFALVSIILFSGCGVTEYSVKDFADVTVVGYTEHGSLSIKVKDSAVNMIYADGKKDKTAALRFAETFRFSYEGQNGDDSFFTNGDVVTINVTYDESMARDLGVSFVDSSFDYTVQGLEDKAEVSPFEGLNVKFSGVAPYGTVQIDKSNCIQYVIDNVTFECDNHDLSNGDKVVVRAEFNAEIAERNGYVFTEDVKKFTVVGLSKYVSTMYDVDYTAVTAKMRYRAEQFVGGTETSYKTFNWFFGKEEADSDSDGYIDEVETDSQSSSDNTDQAGQTGEEVIADEGQAEEINEETDTDTESLNDASVSSKSNKKKRRKTDVQRIKDDFSLSDFKAKFEYTPVECFYSTNPLQYSDNIFYSVYKVTGTFVCEETSGTGFIKPGDTVVGEIYLTVSLTGGSVDIKNNLTYEDNILNNAHAFSIRSYPEYEKLSDDIHKSTAYVVEQLGYYEDETVYEKFANDQEKETVYSKPDVSHINIPSEDESDTETESDQESNSSLTESDLSSDNSDADSESAGEETPIYFEPDDDDGSNEGGDDDEYNAYDEGY